MYIALHSRGQASSPPNSMIAIALNPKFSSPLTLIQSHKYRARIHEIHYSHGKREKYWPFAPKKLGKIITNRGIDEMNIPH